jgi:hypothetical protein
MVSESEEVEDLLEEGEEDEEGEDSSSPQEKKKKQMMMAAGMVAAIVLIASLSIFLLSGSEEGEGEGEGKDDQIVMLTGHGELLVDKIPNLAPIPYPESAPKKELEAKKGAGDKRGEKLARLPNGEVIYTVGKPPEKGNEQKISGVVMVDQIQVQKGDNNEKVVQARILNQGSRFLIDVHLEILFLDTRGKPVLARGINPLVISGGLFGDKVQTLAPGSSRVFLVDATDVPTSWGGNVRAKVNHFYLSP